MKFRHIKLSDIKPGIIYKALCESYNGLDDYSKWINDWKQFDKDIHEYPDKIGGSGFGTILEENFVGFISWDPRQFPSFVIIGHNIVLPKYRNQGIGKHQIRWALDTLKKNGFLCAKVSTKRDQYFTNARKIYESCGFVECAPYRNDGENMIYYSVKLRNH